MPREKLTEPRLRSLLKDPPDSRVEIWDTLEDGLCLRVGPGRMSWTVRYRMRGRQKRLVIGHYDRSRGGLEVMGLAKARKRARDIKVAVDQGHDPQVAKAEAKRAPTVRMVATHYLEVHAKPNKRSWEEDERMLEKYVLPKWGERRAMDIARRDVRRLLAGVARGAPVQANRLRALLSKMWKVAVIDELVQDSPVVGVPLPGRERSRERVLSPKELRSLWRRWEKLDSVAARALMVLVLTGQRSGTVLRMRWEHISLAGASGDLAAGAWWSIPAADMKADRDHRVWLSEPVLDVLAPLREAAERSVEVAPWVFPGRPYTTRLNSVNRAVRTSRDKTGVRDWSPHDLRRTAASLLRELGEAKDIVSTVLGHAEAGVTGKHYLAPALYDAKVRKALTRLGERVRGIVERDEAEVVPFRR